jgi:hypothetical protein
MLPHTEIWRTSLLIYRLAAITNYNGRIAGGWFYMARHCGMG